MIVKGAFDPVTRRPFVQGLLLIPRWRKSRKVDFLVDTGSDSTVLNPADGRQMQLDYSRLSYREPIYGVGARIMASSQNAIIVFATEQATLVVYNVRLDIIPDLPDTQVLPSQLGTDVLHRWRMYWDSPQDRLDFEVITVDALLPEGMFT